MKDRLAETIFRGILIWFMNPQYVFKEAIELDALSKLYVPKQHYPILFLRPGIQHFYIYVPAFLDSITRSNSVPESYFEGREHQTRRDINAIPSVWLKRRDYRYPF
jgi:hypothetical protein